MKRIVSIVLIALYLYNLFGYMGTFLIAQAQIRKEIKQLIKQSVPEEKLVRISITSETASSLEWIKSFEFRYQGKLFDIMRTEHAGDTTHYTCINDVKEQGLFAGLDEHVRRQMESDARTSGANTAFKEHVPSISLTDPPILLVCILKFCPPLFPPSHINEVPFPPPKVV
ncbi:MAG: hypothetical protein ACKVRP_09845 [Bacteroidota bacterium]